LDVGFGLGFYEGAIAQGAGDGGVGNAGRFGNVLDRDAHRGLLFAHVCTACSEKSDLEVMRWIAYDGFANVCK